MDKEKLVGWIGVMVVTVAMALFSYWVVFAPFMWWVK